MKSNLNKMIIHRKFKRSLRQTYLVSKGFLILLKFCLIYLNYLKLLRISRKIEFIHQLLNMSHTHKFNTTCNFTTRNIQTCFFPADLS